MKILHIKDKEEFDEIVYNYKGRDIKIAKGHTYFTHRYESDYRGFNTGEQITTMYEVEGITKYADGEIIVNCKNGKGFELSKFLRYAEIIKEY